MTALLIFAIYFLIFSLLIKMGAYAVSAPNHSYGAAVTYALVSFVFSFALELIGLSKAHILFPPLIDAHSNFALALLCLLVLLVVNFTVTMKLFQISFLRALALIIAVKALIAVLSRLLMHFLASH